jgi:putative membrane protein
MSRRNILSVMLLSLAAAAFGCEQNMSDLGGKPSPVAPIGESHFLKVVANSDQAIIQMSQIALTRSHNDQVRQFAQREIDEHSHSRQQLQQLASSKQAVLPSVLGNIQQGTVAELSSKPDSEFDQAYIQAQVAAHQDEVNDVQAEAVNGADMDLRAYAQKYLPTLQHHLVMAKEIQGTSK